MILWSGNYEIEDDLIELVKSQIKDNQSSFDQTFKLYTTYFLSETSSRPEVIFLDYYAKIIQEMTKELSLYHRSQYSFPFWAQLYTNKSKRFEPHDHFSGSEILSWVHFLSDTTKKCFYFIDSDGNKTYPEQKKGDFIAFPAWTLHAADPPSDKERIVISGNVSLSMIQTQIDSFNYSKCSYHKVEGKRLGLWDVSLEKIKTGGKKGFRTAI